MPPWCLLDHRLVESATASISVWDRGFLLADGVYEVMAVHQGGIFAWDRHIRRLRKSLEFMGLRFPTLPDSPLTPEEQLLDSLVRMVQANELENRSCVYMHISSGVAEPPGRDFAAEGTPSLFAYQLDAPPVFPESPPVSLHLSEDLRRGRVDVKAIGLSAVGWHRRAAAKAGYDDALLHKDGYVNEASASNFFVVVGGEICTAPLGDRILGGISREVLIDALRSEGLEVHERPIALSELTDAREAWLTSTVFPLRPVASLDRRPLPQVAGPYFRRAQEALAKAQEKERVGYPQGAPASASAS